MIPAIDTTPGYPRSFPANAALAKPKPSPWKSFSMSLPFSFSHCSLFHFQHFTKKIIIAATAQKMRFLTPIGVNWKDSRGCLQSTKYSAIMMASERKITGTKI